MNLKQVELISYASSLGGANRGSEQGPIVLQQSAIIQSLKQQGLTLNWHPIIEPKPGKETLPMIAELCHQLAEDVAAVVRAQQFFIVLGGDHSSAIGTWSGVSQGIQGKPLGLIWVDAHMDSHTPATTPTGNIHGMPLAALLGTGDAVLTHVLTPYPKLLPQNVCLIGARSFEPGEENFLKKNNVKIFYMDEIKSRGLEVVMEEAIKIVTQNTSHFGVSIDIDSMDPLDAPGTGVIAPDGIRAMDLIAALKQIPHHSKFIGAEIVEFVPNRDLEQRTERWVKEMVLSLTNSN